MFGSFLIASVAAFISALCFMECATRFPGVSGSAYSYAYFALGEVMGWLYVIFITCLVLDSLSSLLYYDNFDSIIRLIIYFSFKLRVSGSACSCAYFALG